MSRYKKYFQLSFTGLHQLIRRLPPDTRLKKARRYADGLCEGRRLDAAHHQMIQLTKLNNQPFAVNADLIKFVEQAPDTVLTLISGEKIVVRENAEEVIRRIVEFRRVVLEGIARQSLRRLKQRVQSRVAPWIKAVLPVRVIGIGGILGGLFLEGGKIGQVLQPTAAMIVFGGTLGAVLLQFPLASVLAAFRRLEDVISEPDHDGDAKIAELVAFAIRARREGIVSLDAQLSAVQDQFLKKSLMLAIDGTEPQELRKTMELDMDASAEQEENIPRVFESAGGFSPTIGIIGAVLGLIQVMQHLQNIEEVGRGIAVAFVATIYGVGSANLFLLPVAGKLRMRIREAQVLREMTLEGVISILEGMNPRMLETKLRGFLHETAEEAAEHMQ